jgi:Cys-tRNA(Pro)/Cys-tRNA(Cys) deacylase
MKTKLNSMRLLEQHKVPYEVLEYPNDMRDVYKTLVIEPDGGGKPMLVMIAANRQLDLKKLAAVSGHKKVRMASHKDAEDMTGLKVGGISALALTQKNWTVFLDEPATKMQHILISGGQKGVDLRVPVIALMGLTRARVADVGMDDE